MNIHKTEGDVNLSDLRRAWQREHLHEETFALLERDAGVFLHQALSTPCLNALKSSEGIYLTDVEGRRYMDFHGNNVHQLGYGHPAVVEAMKTQLDQMSFSPRRYTNETAIRYAEKLISLAPKGLTRLLFAPGGSLAMGMALKLARIATGRHKTISAWESFHGASLDAISLGGTIDFRHGMGPLLSGTEHVPPPEEYTCLWGCHDRGGCDLKCAAYIEYILEREGDIAAVVLESVRSTPSFPTKAFWQRVRQACDRHGALLILDEIPYALGRTGKMFACEHYDLLPDMLVLGKGLGGGIMPLAALLAKEELNVAAEKSIGHYTHEKNPLACVAGLATLEYLEASHLLDHVNSLGEHAMKRLLEMKTRFSLIGDVRGKGLMLGIELTKDPISKEKASLEAEKVMYRALSRGLSFKLTRGNVITLMPPLIINKVELDEALNIIEGCLAEL
ncbi:MAG: aspartate aminotransferase family protein [Deinococcales bacterium]